MLIILEMHLTLKVSLTVALTNCDLLFLISNLEVGVGLAAQGSHQRFRLLVPFEFTILNILVLCLHRWHCIVAKWLFCFTQEGVGKGGVRSVFYTGKQNFPGSPQLHSASASLSRAVHWLLFATEEAGKETFPASAPDAYEEAEAWQWVSG